VSQLTKFKLGTLLISGITTTK